MIRIKSDKIITKDGIVDGFVYVEGDKIVKVCNDDVPCTTYDMTGRYVSAGFIELHTHGAGGHAFMNSTVKDVIEGSNYHLAHGTTSIVPTISAGTFKTMKDAVVNIDTAKKSKRAKGHILGAHLEGPYLSKKQCGAQCPTFITPPQEEEYVSLINEYGDSITRWTYAPENDIDGSFCRYLTEHGVIASAGHTDAKYEDMLRAVKSGCELVTHFYSCTSTVTRDHGFRSLGVIESAYLMDELNVEIITDGKHLPPELIKLILKLKGREKVILCTDSLEIAGTSVKEGVMSGTEFIVEDGVCKLRDRSAFAGSVATADVLIKTLVKDCGVSISDAVYMMTENPARLLKVNKGRLAEGYDADVVVFDKNIEVTDVFVGENKVF